MGKVLFTADELNSSVFLEMLDKQSKHLLHIPLETFEYYVRDEDTQAIMKEAEKFTYVVHGGLRNAVHFTKWIKKYNLLKDIQKLIHVATDQPTSDHLEKHQIPAVMPLKNAKGIDILEFLLRVSVEGAILYPTTDSYSEEIPGLLKELELPVMEFTVCRERTLDPNELKRLRSTVKNQSIDAVIIHNRSCLNRIRIAFPALKAGEMDIISANAKITEILKEEGIPVKEEASGTWQSLAKEVADYLNT